MGSGPNGLAAALTLASAGVEVVVREAASTIGGGTRTTDLFGHGLRHDICSAVHPLGRASPFFAQANLEQHGLQWLDPQILLGHPVNEHTTALLHRSIDKTISGFEEPANRWSSLFRPLVADFDSVTHDILSPVLSRPSTPIRFARFGLRAAAPASVVARALADEQAAALYGGIAAHLMAPLGTPISGAVGAALTAAAHAVGWPVAEGGSSAITAALAAAAASHNAIIHTDAPVTHRSELHDYDLVLLDLIPSAVLEIYAETLPTATTRAFRRWRHGPAAFKVDYAIRGDVPWIDKQLTDAGTVHLGGTFAEVASVERAVWKGHMPERPFVLVGQQYRCDPSRSNGDLHPLWAYAHVPHGYAGDATEAITDQIERYAPGFRDHIVSRRSMTPADFESYNMNNRGGDILAGRADVRQLLFRPRPGRDPYSLGLSGHFICSAATPPGPGVHGMCGHHAAKSALRWLRRG